MLDLIERWNTAEGKMLYDKVLKAFRNNTPLSSIKGLQKVDKRWDLRGFSFPVPKVLGAYLQEGVKYERARGFSVRYSQLHDIDFSHAIFYRTQWERCSFKNILFHSCDLIQTRFFGCDFDKISFSSSDFKDSILGGAMGSDFGSFTRTDFNECNLTQVFFHSPEISNCNFLNSRIKFVDFNGSRFTNCNFVGELNQVVFRKYPAENGVARENKMKNTSFINAILRDCIFQSELDLTSCRFPSENHLYIKGNRIQIFEKAKDIIGSFWEGQDLEKGLILLEKKYLIPQKTDKDIEVLYRISGNEDGFSERFFDLIKGVYFGKDK